jgi:alpha-beta hydrolase superfamily lysophospholipase
LFFTTTLHAAQGQWLQELQPGAVEHRQVPVLKRSPQGDQAPRFRVIVVVGSGCSGMGSMAQTYFQGLEAAEIWVIHKPHTRPWVKVSAENCAHEFVRNDRLSIWQQDAVSALQSMRRRSGPMPAWLVGISEGADILPALARTLGDELQGLVLLAASGLDPADTVRLQAERLERLDVWHDIRHSASTRAPDEILLHGRSLGYWRDLLGWSLNRPLTSSSWPVLQVWGDADELIPTTAYERFRETAQQRTIRLCAIRLPGANHGLFSVSHEAGQQIAWGLLNRWTEHGFSCPNSPAP